MAIDIRATVTCSLGTLISGSISDDYLQGTGLIKCKGSVEISGTITPAIGTPVTFTYTKGGVTRTIPRKLRVLSSFADPFRRTTNVELGCKLTYLQDLKEPINWKAFDDPGNASYSAADAEVITLPIRASSVMNQCLSKLGLSASTNPLTSQFSIAKFDFGPGYAQVLSDLLVSESYCGYLDASEVLQVFPLTAEGGSGPVIDSSKIIDLGSIGVGQLPGEAVTVSYSTLKLKQPDANTEPLWETNTTVNRFTVPISYTTSSGSQAVQEYRILETIQTVQTYRSLTTSAGETVRVLEQRVTTTTTQAAAVIGGLVTEYLNNGIGFNNGNVQRISTELFNYDAEGQEVFYERNDKGSAPYAHGTAGVPWVFSSSDYVTVDFVNIYPLERERRFTITAGDVQQVETYLYGPWAKTIAGQQSIANARDSFTSAAQVAAYLNNVFPDANEAGDLHLIDHRITQEVRSVPQLAPAKADVINAQHAKGGNAANGYRTESKAELELALGSATAQRRIELSLPYPPDDVFTKTGSAYSAVSSDAEAKANRYGRVQNKLLMGNRNGANFQLAPEVLPSAPFAPFIVQANGLSALYRNNGTSWTMDANGVVVSTDALFWGAVGGTGTFWFPVAPGITTLPTTPAVVDGQMTVSSVVPVWNETLAAVATTRTTLSVESLPYALSALTEPAPLRLRTVLNASSFRSVSPPAAAIAMQALAPDVRVGAAAIAPVSSMAISSPAPEVRTGIAVTAPLVNIAMASPDAMNAGGQATTINIPAAGMAIAAVTPGVSTGVAVLGPLSTVALAAPAPSQAGQVISDPYFSSVVLLLHFNGANNSTAISDSSSKNLTATAYNSAVISTGASKFGGSSLYLTRNYQDSVDVAATTDLNFGTGDFTFEYWYLFVSRENFNYCRVFGHTTTAESSGTLRIRMAADTSGGNVTGEHILCAANSGSARVVGTRQSVIDGAWHHIAFCRSGGTMRCFRDGVLKESVTDNTDYSYGSTGGLRIGSRGGGVNEFSNVYIDDVRVTKGVARYTSSFTVPSAAFPDA